MSLKDVIHNLCDTSVANSQVILANRKYPSELSEAKIDVHADAMIRHARLVEQMMAVEHAR